MDNLIEYGHGFQIKLLSALISDKFFISQIIDHLYPEYFDDDAKNWLCNTIKEYYFQYDTVVSKDVMKAKIASISNKDFKKTVQLAFLEVYKSMDSEDMKAIKESTISFCKNREMTKAVITSAQMLNGGDNNFEAIQKMFEDALDVGIDTYLGHDYQEDFESRYVEEFHKPVSTPWKAVNDVTKGGPGAGHLNVIMAPQGVGKSWILNLIGAEALKQGKTVFHYTLELSDIYVGRRYDTIFSGIHIDELDQNKEEVKRLVEEKNKGKLIARKYITRSISAIGLKGHIKRAIRLGVKPDIILVDYADLLNLPYKGEFRTQIERCYEDLRSIADEFECPVWTASQVSKAGLSQKYIDGSNAAESFAKNNVPDFIMTINRPIETWDMGLIYGFISKSRLGPMKKKFVGFADVEHGIIDLYAEDSQQAKNLEDGIVDIQEKVDQEVNNLIANINWKKLK